MPAPWIELLAEFLPFVVVQIVWGLILFPLARRIGMNVVAYVIMIVIPVVGMFLPIYVLSRAAQSVLAKLDKLLLRAGARGGVAVVRRPLRCCRSVVGVSQSRAAFSYAEARRYLDGLPDRLRSPAC